MSKRVVSQELQPVGETPVDFYLQGFIDTAGIIAQVASLVRGAAHQRSTGAAGIRKTRIRKAVVQRATLGLGQSPVSVDGRLVHVVGVSVASKPVRPFVADVSYFDRRIVSELPLHRRIPRVQGRQSLIRRTDVRLSAALPDRIARNHDRTCLEALWSGYRQQSIRRNRREGKCWWPGIQSEGLRVIGGWSLHQLAGQNGQVLRHSVAKV